jgi:hypothetical protein
MGTARAVNRPAQFTKRGAIAFTGESQRGIAVRFEFDIDS